MSQIVLCTDRSALHREFQRLWHVEDFIFKLYWVFEETPTDFCAWLLPLFGDSTPRISASTGHTLLLLDTTGSYHREVLRTSNIDVSRITTPLMRVQDHDYTKVLLVALPEATLVLKVRQLQDDLERVGIAPFRVNHQP